MSRTLAVQNSKYRITITKSTLRLLTTIINAAIPSGHPLQGRGSAAVMRQLCQAVVLVSHFTWQVPVLSC